MSIPFRGIGVVTRNGLHEFVLLACLRILDTGLGVRAIKDADSINGGPAVLHVLSSCHGSVGDTSIEFILLCWRTVGKEHNDLLGICAARSDIPGQFQTIVGTRGTAWFDSSNCILKNFHVAARAIGQTLHHLRVVVPKLPFLVLVIADLIGLITRKLNNGNPMLPIDALDALILFCDGIDKAVRSVLQCIDTLGAISATHRIIHRARCIQHHHDVERRSNRHG